MDLNTLFNEFIDSINLEIQTRKQKANHRPFVVKDGEKTSSDPNGTIYRFNDFSYNVIPDSPAEVVIINGKSNKDDQKYNATIIGVDDDVLSLYISGEDLPDLINRARLIIDDTKLLEGVKSTILNIKNHDEKPPKVIANALFGIGKIKSSIEDYQDFTAGFNDSQCDTIRKALGSEAIYIWGPPGTGKSMTLSFLADILIKRDLSILISAHTNEAVDNLMEKVVDSFSDEQIEAGQIIRWRVTHSEKIQHITPGSIISAKSDQVFRQIAVLRNKKEKLTIERDRLQNEYINNERSLQELRRQYDKYQTFQKQYNQSIDELKTIEVQIADVDNETAGLKSWLADYNRSFFVIKLVNKRKKESFESALTEKLDLTIKLGMQKEKAVKKCREENELFTKAKEEYELNFEELNLKGITATKLNNSLDNIKKIIADLDEISQEIMGLENELEDLKKDYGYELLKKARVVGTSLTSATLNSQIRERVFDVVIVDEVSSAPCPNLYAACSLAKKKAVLCGDFYQLSPIAENKDAEWLSQSIFDQRGITQKVAIGQNITELTILDTQYRCHPKIANSITNIVYHGKLKNGYQETHPNFEAQHLEPYPNEACVLLDLSRICTNLNPWCERKGNSWLNVNSAELTLKLTQQALVSGIKSVGIITPYREQAKHIKKSIKYLKNRYVNTKVEAATVHSYQGREMDLIIFDLIDCYPKDVLAPFLREGHGTESMRLINVATTRAKGKLIVIANVDYIEQKLRDNKKAILYQWIQYLKTQRHVFLNETAELKYTM
jgi:hypothetical protein